eukprot:4980787-Amphidinium_carterae.1
MALLDAPAPAVRANTGPELIRFSNSTLHNSHAVRFGKITTSRGAKVLAAILAGKTVVGSDGMAALPTDQQTALRDLEPDVLKFGIALGEARALNS